MIETVLSKAIREGVKWDSPFLFWLYGRGVRQRSAKPCTVVQIHLQPLPQGGRQKTFSKDNVGPLLLSNHD